MDNITEIQEVEQRTNTLETEVKVFADSLPYWEKFLAEKILSGTPISENDIDISYSYLLEELGLKEKTEQSEITICCNLANNTNYKSDLLFTKLENVEGVNALIENQTIEFSPNLTIIYGTNGSGKSGYVRLLKKVFYSKAPEEILQNIHIDTGHKSTNAKFTFHSNNTDIQLLYTDKESPEFEQFAVFDGKSVITHLEEKNEFIFRPAGLSFFANLTNEINRVEQKLIQDISKKRAGITTSELSSLFDGNSEVKTKVQSLNARTNIDDLRTFSVFSDANKTEKENIQRQYDELRLASTRKTEEITKFENIKGWLGEVKQKIDGLNKFFSIDSFSRIIAKITDCIDKEEIAKKEGIENFKTDKIVGIGSIEWKNFIEVAEAFAKKQKTEKNIYPQNGDYCLLCHQPLSPDAEKLINSYWTFIISAAEQNAKQAQATLDDIRRKYESLNFDLFPDESALTIWLNEKYPQELQEIKQKLSDKKTLSQNIILDIKNKDVNNTLHIDDSQENEEITEITDSSITEQTCIQRLTAIETIVDTSIASLKNDEQSKELDALLKAKTFLEHKEKFNIHFSKFETYVNNQIWINKAEKENFANRKRQITDSEKELSEKYFNQKYIDTFNDECQKLNGNFGIEISRTGSAGKSYRQLKLKGINPNAVLSEGEQKVIAIADFLAEMQLSEINRGIIFDDPVNSLDEKRKSNIAERLVKKALQKQVIVFSHDLVFVSSLIGHCKERNITFDCHWIENICGMHPGTIWLRNTPSYEKEYKTSEKAQKYYKEAKEIAPEQREDKIKNGFAALRTSYESLVVFSLFKGVVQRFDERVSVDSLKKVFFTTEVRDELLDSFYQCCRYMEGHLHSDKYAYKKPALENLKEEYERFDEIKKKIEKMKEIDNK